LNHLTRSRREFQELQSSSIATLVTPDVSSRSAFLKDLEANQDASVIVYTNGAKFGGFDRELFTKLPKSVKFICSHGELRLLLRKPGMSC
jgi:hypothetical protein